MPNEFRSKAGLIALETDFASGPVDPIVIVVDGSVADPDVQRGIDRLIAALALPVPPERRVNVARDLTQLIVPVNGGDSRSGAAIDTVKALRETLIPEAFAGTPVRALVTGGTARVVDDIQTGIDGLRVIIPFVLVLSFLLLTTSSDRSSCPSRPSS